MPTDQLSRTFAALADPTRRAILARLSEGEATVGQLAEPFAMSFAAVSKHLRVLETAGLVTRGRDAQYRPARLDARPLAVASEWIGDYKKFWADSFDTLGSYLDRLQQNSTPSNDTSANHSQANDTPANDIPGE
jgi:DNA-binding transcriptional ArsR family regulator